MGWDSNDHRPGLYTLAGGLAGDPQIIRKGTSADRPLVGIRLPHHSPHPILLQSSSLIVQHLAQLSMCRSMYQVCSAEGQLREGWVVCQSVLFTAG